MSAPSLVHRMQFADAAGIEVALRSGATLPDSILLSVQTPGTQGERLFLDRSQAGQLGLALLTWCADRDAQT